VHTQRTLFIPSRAEPGQCRAVPSRVLTRAHSHTHTHTHTLTRLSHGTLCMHCSRRAHSGRLQRTGREGWSCGRTRARHSGALMSFSSHCGCSFALVNTYGHPTRLRAAYNHKNAHARGRRRTQQTHNSFEIGCSVRPTGRSASEHGCAQRRAHVIGSARIKVVMHKQLQLFHHECADLHHGVARHGVADSRSSAGRR
jgi:hypothetical protein